MKDMSEKRYWTFQKIFMNLSDDELHEIVDPGTKNIGKLRKVQRGMDDFKDKYGHSTLLLRKHPKDMDTYTGTRRITAR